ncbi:MAG: metallophosphoesterase [Bacteroidales bacterium]|mgnify:CR=1 FL=1|nr:metallophosphoesterase [Bacteroidales bacterium]
MKHGIFKQSVLLLTVLFCSTQAFAQNVSREIPTLKHNYEEFTVEIGLPEPFQALHLTDSHINKIDKRDFERLSSRFNRRVSKSKAIYREIHLMDAIHYVETNDDMLLLHTGDFLDMYSEAGLDYAAMIFNRLKNPFACVGNHEFINVNGKASMDDESRAELYESIQSAWPNDIVFASKVYKGVNFVSIDNTNNNVTKEIFKKMKAEVEKGLPIVIICHIPFYIPETVQERLEQRGGAESGAYASVTGAPREITDRYDGDDDKMTGPRYEQRSTKVTLEFTEWLRSQSLVKAIICGHNHRKHIEQFSPSCVQYTGLAAYDGNAAIINFK